MREQPLTNGPRAYHELISGSSPEQPEIKERGGLYKEQRFADRKTGQDSESSDA